MSAIFLSHSSADAEVSTRLRRWLVERGHNSLFLDFEPEKGIPAGRDWERELYRQLRACRALIVLCTRASMSSKWCFAELAIARSLGKPIFPILVETCELPSQLTEVQIIDWTSEVGHDFDRLAAGLAAAGVEVSGADDWDLGRSPYPGLLAFEERDAAIFFGRDREIGEAIERLNQARRYGAGGLLTVLGASGSGKSSLVRAGVVPRLRSDPSHWLVIEPFRPGGDPLVGLAAALAATCQRHDSSLPHLGDWRALHERLSASPPNDPREPVLREIASELLLDLGRADATPLLVLDQFEELLTHPPEHAASDFLRLLRSIVESSDPLLIVVTTMRSDFLGALQTDPVFGGVEIIAQTVGPMTSASLTEVIERPAELAALELERGLTRALLDDMETEDALPLLAFTLAELYQRRQGDVLDVATYRDQLGGLQGSVARAAQQVLDARRYSEQELGWLRASFLAMARVDRDGRVSRRPVSWRQIAERIAESGAGGKRQVVDAPTDSAQALARARSALGPFTEARLLVARGDGQEDTVEVAHEALFRSWNLLAAWLDENRVDLRLSSEIADAASAWRDNDRSRDFLWRGARLERASELATKQAGNLGTDELEFVRAARAAENRRKSRRKVLARTVVAVSLGVATVMGWQARREARARSLADGQVSRYLAREARDLVTSQLDLALLLGVEAYRTAPTFEAASVLLSALESTPRLETFVPGADDSVRAVAWDPSGGRVAFGGNDQTISVWDTVASRMSCRVELDGLKNWIQALRFGPGGDVLVSASDDGGIRVWAADCSLIRELGRHRGRVSDLAISAGGLAISSGEEDRQVLLWSLESDPGETAELATRSLGELESPVLSVAISSDGLRAAAGSLDGSIWTWDLSSGERHEIPLEQPRGAISDLAWSSDGVELGAATGEGGVGLWSFEPEPAGSTTATALEAPSMRGAVTSLSFGLGGILAAGTQLGTIRIWDRQNPRRAVTLETGLPLLTLALSPGSSRRLLTGHETGSLRLWDAALPGDDELLGLAEPTSLAYGAGGRRLAVVDEGTVRFLDPATGRPEGQPFPSSAAGEEVGDLAFSRDGRFLATGGDDGTARLWDPVSRQQWTLPDGHTAGVRSLAFSGDSELIATGSEDSTVKVWRVADRQLLSTLVHDDWVNSVAFGVGDELASGGDDGVLRLWNARSGEPLEESFSNAEASSPAAITSLGFGPEGDRLAVAYEDGKIAIRGRRSRTAGEPLFLDGPALAVAFGDRGRALAAGSASGALYLWRMSGEVDAEPTPMAEIAGDDGVTALEFHPSEPTLAVVRTRTVDLVDLSGVGAWTANACARVHRNLTVEEWGRFIGDEVPHRAVCRGFVKDGLTRR